MAEPVPRLAVLQLPSTNDRLDVLDIKLSSFVYVIHSGQCIAAATGFVAESCQVITPEARAKSQMTPVELDFYCAWKEGRTEPLPTIDWTTDRLHTSTNSRPFKKASRRAEALNRLYNTDRAEPEHYIHFTQNHGLHVPLVAAVARIIGQERQDAQFGYKRMSATKAQHTTLEQIIQIARRRMAESEGESTKSQVSEKIQWLEMRLADMKEKEADRTRINELGKRELSFDHNGMTTLVRRKV